jgi:DNA-binding response OmpR family regulator
MERKKILVVDDELTIRDLLFDVLKKSGYEVITIPNGEEAIEIIKTQKPDLVLLDSKMPGISGIETLKKIRSFDNKTKIIMLTGFDDVELEKEARLQGASGFLRKNLGIDIIVRAVNELFQTKKDHKKKKILVVDDDLAICSLIKDFLVNKGFKVVTASSGEEALEKFTIEKPILILLDIRLPGMDGIVTLKRIREIDKQVGVIMVTGLKDQEAFEEAQRLGAYDYIVKPFDLDYLEMCVLVRICLVSALLD